MARGVTRYDEAQLQGRIWTPEFLRPTIWLDAADTSTISTVSGRVSQWRDKSGNDHHYSQANAASQPTYEYTIPDPNGAVPLANQIGVRFNAHWLGNSTFAYTGDTMQMFSVHRNNSAASPTQYGRIFSFSQSSSVQDYNNTAGLLVTYGVATNAISIYRNSAIVVSSGNVNNQWIILNARRLAGTARLSTNGGSYLTGTTSTANQNIGHSRVGNDNAVVDSGMNGWICENLVFTTQLSDTQCQTVEGYLAWKWGLQARNLPAAHPFANRPPLIGN